MTFDQAVLTGVALLPFGLAILGVVSLVKKYKAQKRRKSLTLIVTESEFKSGRIDAKNSESIELKQEPLKVLVRNQTSKKPKKKRRPQRGKKK